MQIIPMRDLKNTVEADLRCAEEDCSVYVMKCEKNMQALYEAKIIMEGLNDIKERRTVDGETAISNIRSKYGI